MLHVKIDGDILRYRCGFAAEDVSYQAHVGEDFSPVMKTKSECRAWAEAGGHEDYEINRLVKPEPVQNCLHSVKLQINQILGDLNTRERDVYITAPEPTFRDRIATIRPYKGNRADSPRPFHYDSITEYLLGTWKATEVSGIEADDQLGISHCESLEQSCIATLDKDLDMIPGWHYNFVKQEKYYVTEDQALLNFYYQLLVGDRTDIIIGCPGCGDAAATKVLDSVLEKMPSGYTIEDINIAYYEAALSEYEKAEFGKDPKRKWQLPEGVEPKKAITECGQLLWIWRKPNDLWQPPC